jgi:two-component system heavy metal sensor histidine kinase CusS
LASRPHSIAVRLTIWYATTAFVLVSAVAVGQYRKLEHDLATGRLVRATPAVASDPADVLEERRRFLLVALPFTLILSTILGYWLARRGLAPLNALGAAVSTIEARSLDRTIDVAEAPSEVRALVESFDAVRGRLNAAFASLTQFSTELAHELRTPLHVLRQQTEVALARARTAEEYREVLISSLEELDRLHHMVDDILFLARAEDPRSRIERTELRVADELTDVADYLEPLAAERGVGLVTDAPLPLRVSADRMLLRRALVNLVSNAIRNTPRGGRVSLEATTRDNLLAIQVRDTGVGIPAAALPHIFDRYYRVPGSATGATEGTGLGLAIVKGITALHGGWATVTSALGEGTNVTLIFPLKEPVSYG